MAFKMKNEIDLIDDMIAVSKSLNGTKVKVGVLQGENQWLAHIHEYGCTIKVTPKMRAYLHRIGVHLKPSTTQVVIPERSFLRAGYDQHRDDVLKKAEKTLPNVLHGTLSEDKYLNLIGTLLRDRIKDYAINLSDPPKKDWPTRDPAKNNPLVMSGDMVNGIEFEVEK